MKFAPTTMERMAELGETVNSLINNDQGFDAENQHLLLEYLQTHLEELTYRVGVAQSDHREAYETFMDDMLEDEVYV